MPVPEYRAPWYLRNGHLQSVLPTLFRRPPMPEYRRERITTPDDDFLDLDWSAPGSDTLVIISHGLEGNSRRAYILGMVGAVNDAGWDALAWNYRGCSSEPNRQPIFYHNGATYDLDTVLHHAQATGRYHSIFLLGFSMGGNLSLMYAGQQGADLQPRVRGVVGFSVPCDLTDSSRALASPLCGIYMRRFLKKLHGKVRAKMAQYPDLLDDAGYDEIRTFKQFDDRYTAPLHGFESAEDYWRRCSCARVLADIRVPALVVNALDDPFLAGGCYPRDLAAGHPFLNLETPAHGGHAGFMLAGSRFWSERRAVAFIHSRLRESSLV